MEIVVWANSAQLGRNCATCWFHQFPASQLSSMLVCCHPPCLFCTESFGHKFLNICAHYKETTQTAICIHTSYITYMCAGHIPHAHETGAYCKCILQQHQQLSHMLAHKHMLMTSQSHHMQSLLVSYLYCMNICRCTCR